MGKIIPFNPELHPDACTMEEAVESGLGIYDLNELPAGVEPSDIGGVDEDPTGIISFLLRKSL